MGYRKIRTTPETLPDELATDSELTSAIATHEAAIDPHPQYVNAERFELGFGLLASQLRTFENRYPDAQGNIYPQYFNEQIFLDKNAIFQFFYPSVGDGVYNFIFFQPSNTFYTVTFSSQYKWTEGIPPVITQRANAVDIISCISNGSGVWCVHQGDFK